MQICTAPITGYGIKTLLLFFSLDNEHEQQCVKLRDFHIGGLEVHGPHFVLGLLISLICRIVLL